MTPVVKVTEYMRDIGRIEDGRLVTVSLTKRWRCYLECGHVETRDARGIDPPKKLKCKRCAGEKP